MKNSKLSVIIIEPSDIIIRGLIAILNESDRIHVASTFANIAKYQEYSASKQSVDIVIINPTLVSYGRRSTARTLFPDIHLVALLYNYIDRETLSQFDESIEIYDKPSKIIHRLEQSVANSGSGRSASETGDLSDREQEILVAVAKGMINKEIAEQYNISIHTVIAHRKNISRKTGIKSVSGFVVYALLNNFIDEHEVL